MRRCKYISGIYLRYVFCPFNTLHLSLEVIQIIDLVMILLSVLPLIPLVQVEGEKLDVRVFPILLKMGLLYLSEKVSKKITLY